ncbi:MAG: endonuclease [Clostridia bacterium]|nr:endonuclease [Clostridia bacterium]
MRKLLRILGILIGFVLLVAVLGVGYLTITEYRPKDVEEVKVEGSVSRRVAAGEVLNVVTWNIGYGALGDNADFFMDGGTSVYTADNERVQQNLAVITAKLTELNPDFILLQEVDADSSRSHDVDERDLIQRALAGNTGVQRVTAFANNFKAFVPYPLPPIGKVDSGLYTLSAVEVASAERISLPCPFSWPIRTVNLKRCLLVTRIPVQNSDRELVLVNLHLEAYDDGEGKVAQTRQLAEFLQNEVDKGNYVIAGGDFNQVFSNIDTSAYLLVEKDGWQPGSIDADQFDARLALRMDNSAPTCRSLKQAFAGASRETFQFYMIDGFIISENVRVQLLQTIETNFVASDHNPVRMQFVLIP